MHQTVLFLLFAACCGLMQSNRHVRSCDLSQKAVCQVADSLVFSSSQAGVSAIAQKVKQVCLPLLRRHASVCYIANNASWVLAG